MAPLLHRRVAVLAALAMTASLLTLATDARPARALSQYCGKDAIGVGVDYPSGLDNGHPSNESENLDGWGGLPAVRAATTTSLVADRVAEALEFPVKIIGDQGFDEDDLVPKGLNVGFSLAAFVATIVKTAADIAALEIGHQSELVDACSGTLTGDLTDALFVALMQEDLAYLQPELANNDGGEIPHGVRLAPTAMFLMPDDGMPAWQRDAHLYSGSGGHADLDLYYQDGFLNADYVGVAATVRNEIALLDALGISTGGGTVYDPATRRWVTIPGAKEMWHEAVAEAETGDLRAAYAQFARAYQTAVTGQTGS